MAVLDHPILLRCGEATFKSRDTTDKHNYRPIVISTTMSKVLERVILHKIDSYLYTTDNQFGLKQNQGTDIYRPTLII